MALASGAGNSDDPRDQERCFGVGCLAFVTETVHIDTVNCVKRGHSGNITSSFGYNTLNTENRVKTNCPVLGSQMGKLVKTSEVGFVYYPDWLEGYLDPWDLP